MDSLPNGFGCFLIELQRRHHARDEAHVASGRAVRSDLVGLAGVAPVEEGGEHLYGMTLRFREYRITKALHLDEAVVVFLSCGLHVPQT